MIATFILYMTLVGGLAAGAAWITEQACIRLGVARRWSWMAAMLLMCAAPLLPSSALPRTEITVATAGTPAPFGVTAARGPVTRAPHLSAFATVFPAVARATSRADGWLLLLWVVASATLLALALTGALRLVRARRAWTRWKRGRFSMPTIWVSDDVGPAAFGAGDGEIVIPRWAMTLPLPDRRLLLQHERAHVHARDPLLLAVAQATVIALPWLLPLRWAFRRLQRAVEHDCDRRVLQRPGMVRRYADLLLHVAERGLVAPPWAQRVLASASSTVAAPALMMVEPDLEARLRALIRPRVTWRSRSMALGSAGVASLLTLMACSVPLPRTMNPVVASMRSSTQGPRLGVAARNPSWIVRTAAASGGITRSLDDSLWFAHTDSLVIEAIERTRPALLKLATTPSPFVAVTLSPDNAIIAHSVTPPASRAPDADTLSAVQLAALLAAAGVPMSANGETEFRSWMNTIANDPEESLDSLGVSHLLVGQRELTVLWVRLKNGVRN